MSHPFIQSMGWLPKYFSEEEILRMFCGWSNLATTNSYGRNSANFIGNNDTHGNISNSWNIGNNDTQRNNTNLNGTNTTQNSNSNTEEKKDDGNNPNGFFNNNSNNVC